MICSIDASSVFRLLQDIQARGTVETAHRVKVIVSQVMRYAIVTGRADHDPCPDLRGALPSAQVKHMAAITDPADVAHLLREIEPTGTARRYPLSPRRRWP